MYPLNTMTFFAAIHITDTLAKEISTNDTIISLEISKSNIKYETLKQILKNKTIKTLYISDNNLGPNEIKELAKNTTITTLDISGNGVIEEAVRMFLENYTITNLILSKYYERLDISRNLEELCYKRADINGHNEYLKKETLMGIKIE